MNLAALSAMLKPGDDKARSSHWPETRHAHLLVESFCQACGTILNLTVHHIFPFHLFPQLELFDGNLITLCETPSTNCHFLFGHDRNWKLYVPTVRDTVKLVLAALKDRKDSSKLEQPPAWMLEQAAKLRAA